MSAVSGADIWRDVAVIGVVGVVGYVVVLKYRLNAADEERLSSPEAQVPPGKHQFWIELKDNLGRVGGGPFSFQVGQ